MKPLSILFRTLFVIIFFSTACEKTVDDIDLPEADKKLVLHSYIFPGCDTVIVHLTSDIPYFSEDYSSGDHTIDNATVKFSDDNHEITLVYDDNEEHYYGVLNNVITINSDKKYTIKASAPDFQPVKGTCRVPKTKPGEFYLTDHKIIDDVFGDDLLLEFEIHDNPNENNYYRMVYFEERINWQNDTSYVRDEYVWKDYFTAKIFDDKNKQGEVIKIKATVRDIKNEKNFRMMLLSVDEHYYNYHDKINNYEYGGPFSEPTILYSNIENGLGVLGSYTKRYKDYKITN